MSGAQPELRVAGRTAPVTIAQSLWLKHIKEMNGGLGYRSCYMALHLVGPLNVDSLRRGLEFVTQRHESLRTRIVASESGPVQVIDPTWETQLEIVDVSNVSAPSVRSHATKLCEEFLDEDVDLSVGPLFAAKLYKLLQHEHVLLLALEHVISDGLSLYILEHEIWTLYDQAARGSSLALAALPLQFADYAIWEQQTYSTWLKRHGPYWKDRMTGAPRIKNPLDSGLVASERPALTRLSIPFGSGLSDGLRTLARRECVVLPVVVLVVYAIAMSQWCEQSDLTIAFVSHGRHRSKFESTIGFLSNVPLLRIEVIDTDTFVSLLDQVNTEVRNALAHEDFNRASHLVPECSTELGFNWLPTTWMQSACADQARLTIEPLSLNVPSLFDFWLYFHDTPLGIVAIGEYRPDRFAPSAIDKFGRSLILLSEKFTQYPLATMR